MTDTQQQMDIQEQVNDFIEKHYTFAHDDLPDDLNVLIRQVVEGCCKAADKANAKFPITVSCTVVPLIKEEIHDMFPWLGGDK